MFAFIPQWVPSHYSMLDLFDPCITINHSFIKINQFNVTKLLKLSIENHFGTVSKDPYEDPSHPVELSNKICFQWGLALEEMYIIRENYAT